MAHDAAQNIANNVVLRVTVPEMLAEALSEVGVAVELDRIPIADHVFVGTDPRIPLRRSVEYLAAALG